jgi:hypothetical protein
VAKGKYQEWLTPDGLLLLEGWARDGLTDKQIAHNIGVSERSFTEWKDRFSSISSALKKGKAPVDYTVENALLQKALGFTVKVKKPIKLKTKKQLKDKGTIEEERIEYAEEEVYIPPDTTAQIFWPKSGNCIHGRGILPEDGTKVSEQYFEKDLEITNAIAKF